MTHKAEFVLDLDPGGGAGALVEARQRLRDWLSRAGLLESTLLEVLIAVGEATTNAVEHSGAALGHAGQGAIQVRAN